jgi:hypothetical protein
VVRDGTFCNNLFAKQFFPRQNFLFQNTKENFGGEKITLKNNEFTLQMMRSIIDYTSSRVAVGPLLIIQVICYIKAFK